MCGSPQLRMALTNSYYITRTEDIIILFYTLIFQVGVATPTCDIGCFIGALLFSFYHYSTDLSKREEGDAA